MLVRELFEDNLHDQRVNFVLAWCDENLDDYEDAEEADDAFWSDVKADIKKKNEALRLRLTKDISFDILDNTLDNRD